MSTKIESYCTFSSLKRYKVKRFYYRRIIFANSAIPDIEIRTNHINYEVKNILVSRGTPNKVFDPIDRYEVVDKFIENPSYRATYDEVIALAVFMYKRPYMMQYLNLTDDEVIQIASTKSYHRIIPEILNYFPSCRDNIVRNYLKIAPLNFIISNYINIPDSFVDIYIELNLDPGDLFLKLLNSDQHVKILVRLGIAHIDRLVEYNIIYGSTLFISNKVLMFTGIEEQYVKSLMNLGRRDICYICSNMNEIGQLKCCKNIICYECYFRTDVKRCPYCNKEFNEKDLINTYYYAINEDWYLVSDK